MRVLLLAAVASASIQRALIAPHSPRKHSCEVPAIAREILKHSLVKFRQSRLLKNEYELVDSSLSCEKVQSILDTSYEKSAVMTCLRDAGPASL